MFKNRWTSGMIKNSLLMGLFGLLVLAQTAISGDDHKRYDDIAKTTYSENDVKAFVYQWFAGFDHQADISVFIKHLPSEKVDMYFPDFPIKSLNDFKRWYDNVIDSIQWNTHIISNLQVSGNEASGFFVSLDVRWKAKTYQGESYDMNVHQDWNVTVGKDRNFIIKKHVARFMAH